MSPIQWSECIRQVQNGELSVAAASAKYGVSRHAICARIRAIDRAKRFEAALTKPLRRRR